MFPISHFSSYLLLLGSQADQIASAHHPAPTHASRLGFGASPRASLRSIPAWVSRASCCAPAHLPPPAAPISPSLPRHPRPTPCRGTHMKRWGGGASRQPKIGPAGETRQLSHLRYSGTTKPYQYVGLPHTEPPESRGRGPSNLSSLFSAGKNGGPTGGAKKRVKTGPNDVVVIVRTASLLASTSAAM